ncbi:MAG: hypothetical protein ACTHMC_24085 [Pseudobacter sp.]|uniref:hypothetical protein n=1 Tax=Pseudobacter sp. TaxID=2045420 RepID=UPI003F81D3FE
MKRWKSVPVIILAVSTIISCSKSATDQIAGPPENKEEAKSLIKQPGTRIKALCNPYDTTLFYYNKEGRLDSVIKNNERHIMYGKGKYADTMASFWGNYLDVLYVNIQYNSEGRITEYTKLRPNYPASQPVTYLLEYNSGGDLIAQRMQAGDDRTLENFYEYNQDHDLVWNNMVIEGAGDHITTLRTDGYLNPFYKMDFMYIIFGGNEMQQMVLSKHNLAEVYREYDGTLLTFHNEYDNDGRLIKKTNLYYDEYFTIAYY